MSHDGTDTPHGMGEITGATTGDARSDELMREHLATGGQDAQGPYEGLLPDYVTDPNQPIYRGGNPIAPTQTDYIPGMGRVGQMPISNVTNEQINGIATGGPALRAQWMMRLAQAGIIDGGFDPNVWNPEFTGVLQSVAVIANGNGMLLQEAIDFIGRENQRQRRAKGGGGGGGVKLPAYVAPDAATLAQSVKRSVRDKLRRDPNEAELDALAAELSTNYRAAYDSQIKAAQGQSTTQVDPQARFAEMMESKYANELTMLDDRDQTAQATATGNQQMGFIDRVLGGM